MTLVLGSKNRPASLAYKSDLTQKRPKYDIKYFSRLYVLSYLFMATNSLLAAMRFFLIFPFFFFLYYVRSFSPKPPNIKIYFFCKAVQLQTQFCLPKYFWATPLVTLPKSGPKTEFYKNEQNENRSN